jgi:hypothetical protein
MSTGRFDVLVAVRDDADFMVNRLQVGSSGSVVVTVSMTGGGVSLTFDDEERFLAFVERLRGVADQMPRPS